jgi:hypothetical protein
LDRSWNVDAKAENAKVSDATYALVVMRSVDPGVNSQVLINQPIPNFPATPDTISEMTGTLLFPRFLFFRLISTQCKNVATSSKPLTGAFLRVLKLK